MAVKEVTFISQYTRHEIVRFPKTDRPTALGAWVQESRGKTYKFEPWLDRESGKLVGILKVREGEDKSTDDHHGTLRLDEEIGKERDAADFLRAHRAFVADPTVGGGEFWELGHAPGTLYPRVPDLRKMIRRAGVHLEEEALVEIIETEKASHGRREVIEDAEGTLAIVREEKASLQASAAEAEQQAEPPAAKAKPKAKATA